MHLTIIFPGSHDHYRFVAFSSLNLLTKPGRDYLTGAKKAREVIFAVLRDACINGDLSIPEAIQAAKEIFSENARHLYKIKAVSESFDSNDIASLSMKLGINTSAQAVAFVRIIWIDASGQHRCRVSLLF